MNGLMRWALSQPQMSPFLPSQLSRVSFPEESEFPKFWRSPMMHKVLIQKIVSNVDQHFLDPNLTTILGGMCLINTVEMKRIYNREIVFTSESDFEKWYANWYPRIDQIHDAVGVPPKMCRKIIYVSEDSFFAGRLASYTGLDKLKIQKILHKVHQEQGHPVLARYFKAFGYTGELTCVYTSDLEEKLETALRMWERILDHTFRTCDRDFAKVELMYTGFWLDILGIKDSAVIYEAASKMILRGWVKLDSWFKKYPYGSEINHNLGVVGYIPFLTTKGDGSKLAFDEVPNFSNHKTFIIADEDISWYVANLLFVKETVIEDGPLPLSLSKKQTTETIRKYLSQYFDLA